MNTRFTIALLMITMLLFSACEREEIIIKENTSKAVLSTNPTALTLDAAGTPIEITINSNQPSYTFSSSESWCKVVPAGRVARISAEKYTGTTARNAVVTIKVGKGDNVAEVTVQITQAKPLPEKVITVEEIDFVWVEGGSFKMGAQNTDPAAENYGVASAGSHFNANQTPIHKVTLSDYYIGRYLITQEQWVKIMGTNPSKNLVTGHLKYPVEYVDWTMANAFVTELSKKTGKTFRLPTEAEWEYAARGGRQSKGFMYSGGNTANLFANFVANTTERDARRTSLGGAYTANELGIFDMSGNLYEWCSDLFGAYTSEDQVNPTGATTGVNRVTRGGSWWHLATTLYYRGNNVPSYTGTHVNAGLTGIRIVYIPN